MGVCPKGYNVAWWRRALRIALVNPPQDTTCPLPPMGLSLIAAVLERKGHRVTVVDANALKLRPEEVAPHITNCSSFLLPFHEGVGLALEKRTL